jgi:amino acid transporter
VTGTFLALEMAALLVVCYLGFTHVSRPVSALWHAQTIGDHGTLVGVGAGLVAAQTATAIFAYNGYGAAVYFAEETHGASRVVGKVILISLAVTVAAEIIPMTAVLLGAPSLQHLLSDAAPMEYFVTSRGSVGLNTIVSVAIAIAIINATVAITLQAGRTLYSAARDRAFPDVVGHPLAYVHPTLQTPLWATLFVGLTAAVVASFVPLSSLIIATGATLIALYIIVALSAFVGRRTGVTSHAPYKMPAYPLAPVVVMAALVYVTTQVWEGNPWQVIITLSALAVGYLYYFAYLHPRRTDRWTMRATAPAETEPHGEIAIGPIGGLEQA